MPFTRNLFVPEKHDYIRGGKRPKVDCILCAILEGNPSVQSLLIWQNELLAVSVNLYPYNSGHLLLFPKRHIYDPREMTDAEDRGISRLNRHCMDLLDKLYQPLGYNLGFNIGDASGASIEHLHQHLVPRYVKELGFVDIITGSKIIIENPTTTMDRLKEAFAERPLEF